MKIVQNTIRRAFAALGYVPKRPSSESAPVRFENFENLSVAFELFLNDRSNRITPNEIRPMLLARLLGTPPSEAYYIIEALYKCKTVPGDVCEFGVAQGETSALMANEILQFNGKNLHLFDSFEGLPRPSAKDQLKDDIFSLGDIEAYTGTMSCPEEMVQSRLKAISFPSSRYFIHKGFIEELITEDQNLPTKVCFAYVDFDFYEPIKIALEFLHDVTQEGSIIIVDDYDFFSTGVKTAVDEFVEEKRKASGIDYECLVPDTRCGHFAVLSRKG